MRVKICKAVWKAKKPPNITAEEWKAFLELNKNRYLQILHAHKGNATVVLNAVNYDRKAHDLLDDDNFYAVLTKDPSRLTERASLSLLRNVRKEGQVMEEFYNKVRASDVVIRDDEMLVSYNVKSVFTSIPVEESIQVCERRLILDNTLSECTQSDIPPIIELLRFCLKSMPFQYRGQHYKHLDSVAMVSSVSR